MFRNDGMTFPLATYLNSSNQMKYDFVFSYMYVMHVYLQLVKAKDKQTHTM